MDDSGPPSTDRLITLLVDGERDATRACLDRLLTATTDVRRRAVQSLSDVADERPAAFDGLVPALVPFLEDEERSVRLSTAKLLVAIAESEPGAVRPVVSAVAARLADDDEFYYVRARCAEALGYVAREYPDVGSPELLADLQVGLSFDEPEVREKLAKALEHVALGDPARLRHRVSTLADHLDDGDELVRYHLTTALVAIGCASAERLDAVTDELGARLDDENAYVRGRAVEALGALGSAGGADASPPTIPVELLDDDAAFVRRRARFALESGDKPDASPELGTLDSVRTTTAEAVDAITSTDEQCPHCGLALPAGGPPLCPQCGAPR